MTNDKLDQATLVIHYLFVMLKQLDEVERALQDLDDAPGVTSVQLVKTVLSSLYYATEGQVEH